MEGFEKRWSEVREFNRLIRSVGSTAWVAPAIVVLNILVFAAMTIVERRWGAFEPQVYLNWGANFAPLTLAGQWWRLFTALFVHFDLLHLLLNMRAFWNIGRMTERLYGGFRRHSHGWRGENVASYCGRRGVPATMSRIRWNYFRVSPV